MRLPKRYRHDGLTVPYAALWAPEHEGIGDAVHAYYARRGAMRGAPEGYAKVDAVPVGDELYMAVPDDYPFTEIINGVRWLKPRDLRGHGKALFGELHSTRQRSCMVKRRCQVCGGPVPEGPLLWVTHMPVDGNPKGPLTSDAPTCDMCRKRALRLCPALIEGTRAIPRMYLVREWEVWGARARVRRITETGADAMDVELELPFETLRKNPAFAITICGQALARFLDYEEVPYPNMPPEAP